jgi:hypothetical protein
MNEENDALATIITHITSYFILYCWFHYQNADSLLNWEIVKLKCSVQIRVMALKEMYTSIYYTKLNVFLSNFIFIILVILFPTNAHPCSTFIRHFTILLTCFNPCGPSSGRSVHEHLPIFLYHTYKSLQSSVFKICLRCVVYLLCCVFHVSWSITLAFRVCLCCPVTYKSRTRVCICWK